MNLKRSLAVVLVVLVSGCGSNLCEKSTKTAKIFTGDCGADAPALLGGMCTANLSKCSDADQKQLDTALSCMEKLPACISISKDAWKLQRDTCLAPLSTLSRTCLDAFFEGMMPGVDAGQPDAGPHSIDDGGNGLVLVGAANEDTVALAWEARRAASVDKWLLVETDAVGENRTETEVTPGSSINLTIPDSGMAGRRYFLAGLNANGDVLTGAPFMPMVIDAGSMMCTGPNDCATDRVCDLGQCRLQLCMFGGMNTCPNGYACFAPGECRRTTADGGAFNPGGGTRDAGVQQPLPMISNELGLTPRPPMPGGSINVGAVAGKRPDIAAFDTARVALAMEQEGQLIAHPSTARGNDFIDELTTSVGLDTTGSRVHLAWEPTSNALFACYVVGTGIRIQKSIDRGRTWGRVANTFIPPLSDDGGIGELYRDCDLAPWKNGGVLMVTAEQELLAVRELDSNLQVIQKATAFTSQFTDAGVGGITAPSHPAIATNPGMSLVHVTFTATRLLTGGIGDTEPYGIVRNGTSPYTMPSRLTPFAIPSAFPEDWTAISIHPKTGQAVAAFTTLLSVSAQQYSTVFISLFNPQTSTWSTGSHLNLLVVDQNTTVLFPQKAPTDTWFVYSPAIAPLARDNLFAISVVAGPRTNGIGEYRQYLIPFDLDRVPDITAGRGWFVRPISKISDVRVLDPRASLSGPQPPVSALAGDSQISVYGVFVQGAGVAGDVEAEAQYFHWP